MGVADRASWALAWVVKLGSTKASKFGYNAVTGHKLLGNSYLECEFHKNFSRTP